MKPWGKAAAGCVLLAVLLSGCKSVASVAPPMSTASVGGQEVTVSLTFDDGNADNFAVAPVLQQYGMHATFYIPSNLVGGSRYMTWDQLHTLQDDGHEIGGHTLDHVNIGELAPTALRHEVCDDRQNLLNHGFRPFSFAYPFGGYDAAARQMVQECGYADARTIGAGPEQRTPSDVYELRALPYIVADTDFTKLQRYVVGTRQEGGGWVILIFHHVCDACDYYAVKPDVLSRFVRWLSEQQTLGRLRVATVGEVVLNNALR